MRIAKWCVAFVAVVGALVGAYYVLYIHNAPQPVGEIVRPEASVREVPEGYTEYRNQPYHFSVLYPEALEVVEYGKQGGAFTAAFQDPRNLSAGFEIFAVPYAEPKISQERFMLDVPSGVMENRVDIVVDAIPATTFASTNASMGETQEVWFVHKGLLYEAATYKAQGSELLELIQTWQFVD